MRLIQLIRDVEDLSPTDKCLLYTLATYGNAKGEGIYPGLDLLAKKLKVHENTVRRSLKRIIAAGYLEEDGFHKHTKKYIIPMSKIWTDAQIAPNKGKPKKVTLVPAPPPGEEESQSPPTTMIPDDGTLRSGERSEEDKAKGRKFWEDFRAKKAAKEEAFRGNQ